MTSTDENRPPTNPTKNAGFSKLPKALQAAQKAQYEKRLERFRMGPEERARHEITQAVRKASNALADGRGNLVSKARLYRGALTEEQASKAASYIMECAEAACAALQEQEGAGEQAFTL